MKISNVQNYRVEINYLTYVNRDILFILGSIWYWFKRLPNILYYDSHRLDFLFQLIAHSAEWQQFKRDKLVYIQNYQSAALIEKRQLDNIKF